MEVLTRQDPRSLMSHIDAAVAAKASNKSSEKINSPPGPDALARDAGATRRRPLPTRTKANDKQNIGFTFVDQSKDLKSLADKRIVSSTQRHAIRSHVMKSVRHSENLIGKKRPTGREATRKAVTKVLNTALPGLEAQLISSPASVDGRLSSTGSESSEQQIIKIPPDPSPRLDPFYTLPGNDGPAYPLIETLVQYCFQTFLPMTFPVERNRQREDTSRGGVIMRAKMSNPGVFFGLMAIVAAHRAITSRRHFDLKPSAHDHGLLLFDDEYAVMKDYAIRATRTTTMERATMDEEAMEATFSLVAAATIIGNFQEARIYLEGIRQNLNGTRKLTSSTSVVAIIPTTDVKAAAGMLSRPMFEYPWASEEETQLLLNRAAPESSSPMINTGTAFYKMNRASGLDWDLNAKLFNVIRVAIAICWFGQASSDRPHSLTESDHDIFKRKSIEIEHGALDYVYENDDFRTLYVHPVEHLIRLTILAMASSFLTQALPSAGLGRAMTNHQVNAHQAYRNSLEYSSRPTLLEKQCLIWVGFQAIHSATGQPEETYFISAVAELLTELKITAWEEIESCLFTFLYIPAMQQRLWYQIWIKIRAFSQQSHSATGWKIPTP